MNLDLFKDCDAEALKEIEELQAENERLKGELKQTEAQDQVVIDGLRKENAKLKCLALHLFEIVANKEASEWEEMTECLALSKNSHIYKGHEYRWLRIAKKCSEERRKAKKALREGK